MPLVSARTACHSTGSALPFVGRVLTSVWRLTRAKLTRGASLLRDSDARDAITLVATGSEVGVAVDAAERLATVGLAVRVVSMPAPQLFQRQDEAWRRHLLPPGGRRVSIEAGVTDGWRALVGERGLAIGIDRFGESAPAEVLAEHFGLTGEAVAKRVREWAARA